LKRLSGGLPGRGGAGVGEGLVEHLVELAAIDDLDEGRAFGAGGDHPDGGGVLDADALAEGVVRLDRRSELALGIDGEGQGDTVALSELLRELAQGGGADDGDLVGEDLVAVLVAEGLGAGVEPAAVDRRLKAPVVHGKREIVAQPGNLVLGDGLFEEGVGAGAVGALHVRELDQGDAGAGGRTEGGGVMYLGSGLRCAELGMEAGCGYGQKGGGGKAEEKAGPLNMSGDAMCKGKKTRHSGWTAPLLTL